MSVIGKVVRAQVHRRSPCPGCRSRSAPRSATGRAVRPDPPVRDRRLPPGQGRLQPGRHHLRVEVADHGQLADLGPELRRTPPSRWSRVTALTRSIASSIVGTYRTSSGGYGWQLAQDGVEGQGRRVGLPVVVPARICGLQRCRTRPPGRSARGAPRPPACSAAGRLARFDRARVDGQQARPRRRPTIPAPSLFSSSSSCWRVCCLRPGQEHVGQQVGGRRLAGQRLLVAVPQGAAGRSTWSPRVFLGRKAVLIAAERAADDPLLDVLRGRVERRRRRPPRPGPCSPPAARPGPGRPATSTRSAFVGRVVACRPSGCSGSGTSAATRLTSAAVTFSIRSRWRKNSRQSPAAAALAQARRPWSRRRAEPRRLQRPGLASWPASPPRR